MIHKFEQIERYPKMFVPYCRCGWYGEQESSGLKLVTQFLAHLEEERHPPQLVGGEKCSVPGCKRPSFHQGWHTTNPDIANTERCPVFACKLERDHEGLHTPLPSDHPKGAT